MNTESAQLVDLYLRLSNADDTADSLERQEADLRAWADREGLTVRMVHRDYGRSGFKSNVRRDGFVAAVKALTSGEIGTLAVWKLDRLSRQGAGQVGLVLDDVERVGGRLVFLRDGLDTSTGTAARLPIVTLSEIARAESVNTSVRVRSRKAKDRAAGRYLGGLAPYGYRTTADRLWEPCEPEYGLMRELVDRVLSGESLNGIARDWNTRQVPTRRAQAHLSEVGRLPGPGCTCRAPKECVRTVWRPSTLSASLRSPGLAGLMPERARDERTGKWCARVNPYRDPKTGETVSLMAPGCAPIASESEQAQLLALMDSRLRQYGRGKRPVRQPSSLLGGLLICASCNGKAHTFGNSYRCRKWKASGNECPAPLTVSVDVVETAVVRAWANRLSALHDEPDSPLLRAVAQRWLAKNDPGPMREREDLTAQIVEARARLDRADDDHYVRGSLDAERHARITARLQDEIASMSARLSALPQLEADLGALLDPELSLPAFEASTVHEQRELLRLALVRVECSPAPRRGARFVPEERLSFAWVGEA